MKNFQDRLDFQICRLIIGIPLFLIIMYMVFSLSFCGFGAWLTEILGTIFFYMSEILQTILISVKTDQKIVSLIIGILSDIASVLAFLPQTAIFFFLLKFLSDCGYMVRAVFVTDTFLQKFGLSGNALIPFALGCGCSVPAVIASHELNPNERKILLSAIPFLLCNARFPLLIFLTDSFFPQHKTQAAFFFYLLSLFTVFLSCRFSSFRETAPPLIVHLQDYKIPKISSLLQEVKIKSAEYWNRTISLIFLCSVALRFSAVLTPYLRFTEIQTKSILYLLGEFLSHFFTPLGFGKAPFSAALVAGFFAKENILFVFEMLSVNENFSSFSIPARISFISFSMFYLPCFSSVITILKESNLRKTLLFLIRTFLIAYILSLFLYTISCILVALVKF